MNCPLCGKADSKQLLTSFLCTNLTCKYYDDKWDYEINWGSGKELLAEQKASEELASDVCLASSPPTSQQSECFTLPSTGSIVPSTENCFAIGSDVVATGQNSFAMGYSSYVGDSSNWITSNYITSGLGYQDEKAALETRVASLELRIEEMSRSQELLKNAIDKLLKD